MQNPNSFRTMNWLCHQVNAAASACTAYSLMDTQVKIHIALVSTTSWIRSTTNEHTTSGIFATLCAVSAAVAERQQQLRAACMQAAQLASVHTLALLVWVGGRRLLQNIAHAAYQPNRPLPCRHRQYVTKQCTVHVFKPDL
jgi:hypothetical protein